MRLILYTGKGGVGKTTTAAATAVHAAARGRRTLVLSADAAHSLGDVLEQRLDGEPREVASNLDALEVDARMEMARHWGSVREYLVSLFRYQGIDAVVAEELALLPGAEEISTLLAVEQFARSGKYDCVVVDCAPTDSALRLLTLPDVAHSALRLLLRIQRALAAVVTPLARNLLPVPLPDSQVFKDAEKLLYRRLRSLRQRIVQRDTSVRLVVTPERMVIDEARRAYTDLCLFEVPCDAVVMNRMLSHTAAGEQFFQEWGRLQEERLREVEALFAPLPVLCAPLAEDEVTGCNALLQHGQQLFGEQAPDALFCEVAGLRFAREGEGYRVSLSLPHVRREELDVAKLEGEIVIQTGARRRALSLPRRIAAMALEKARLEGEILVLHFIPAARTGGEL